MISLPRRRIRVVVYQSRMSPGGAQDVTLTLLRHLRRERFEPILIVRLGDGEWMDRIPKDVPVHVLDARVRIAWLRLARELRRIDPDVVLSMSSTGNLTACLGHWFARARYPLMVSERNTFSNAWRHSRKFAAIRLVKSVLYRRACKVVAVSRGVGEDLVETLRFPAERVTTIYNPIVGSGLLARAQEPVGHAWFRDRIPVVLAAGRLVEQKDFGMLLRAFHSVRERCEARLMILGDGPQRAQLEHLANELGLADHVSMPGFVQNPAAYMSRCAVFVLSSRYEGLPGVLIQAMACGAPVISTDCPSGPAEIIEDGENGILVPPGDPAAVSAAILSILESPSLSADLRERGRVRASDFSVENALAHFEGTLESVVEDRRDLPAEAALAFSH